MPTYLCHGFRWHRASIRVFVVVQNLDDAAPDWVIRPGTARSLITTFYELFDFLPIPAAETVAGASASAAPAPAPAGGRTQKSPSREGRKQDDRGASRSRRSKSLSRRKTADAAAAAAAAAKATRESAPPRLPSPVPGVATTNDGRDEVLAVQDGSPVKLLEEYDPQRLDEVSRPHAYVADYVARIDLSMSVGDAMAGYERQLRYEQQQQQQQLKDKDRKTTAAGTAGAGAPTNLPAMTGPSADEGEHSVSLRGSGGAGWLELLRDQLQRGEEIRWYVVVNGDEERDYGGSDGGDVDGQTQQEGTSASYSTRNSYRGQTASPGGTSLLSSSTRSGTTAPHLPSISPQPVMGSFMDPEREEPATPTGREHGDDGEENDDGDDDACKEDEAERGREREREKLRIELGGDRDILRADDDDGGGDERDSNGRGRSSTNSTNASGNDSTAPRRKRQHYLSLEPRTPAAAARRPSSGPPTGPPTGQAVASSNRHQHLLQQHQRLAQSESSTPPTVPPIPPTCPPPPALRQKKSFDLLRPRTPSGRSAGGGGFRRLFSRGKAGDV